MMSLWPHHLGSKRSYIQIACTLDFVCVRALLFLLPFNISELIDSNSVDAFIILNISNLSCRI